MYSGFSDCPLREQTDTASAKADNSQAYLLSGLERHAGHGGVRVLGYVGIEVRTQMSIAASSPAPPIAVRCIKLRREISWDSLSVASVVASYRLIRSDGH